MLEPTRPNRAERDNLPKKSICIVTKLVDDEKSKINPPSTDQWGLWGIGIRKNSRLRFIGKGCCLHFAVVFKGITTLLPTCSGNRLDAFSKTLTFLRFGAKACFSLQDSRSQGLFGNIVCRFYSSMQEEGKQMVPYF